MALTHSPQIATNGLVFYYDMGNPQKSWKGAPTFNASLQDGQNDVNPWGGDGAPTALGIEPNIRFRGRKVAKFLTGTSGNCYLNGAAKLSTGTASTVWTSTFYLKRVDGTALSSVGMYQYINGNTNVNTTVSVTAVEDGWYKAVYTRSGLVAGYPTLTGMFSLGAATQYYFADWQCENISVSSPWVSGTRSNTQAVLDLVGGNTVTANSLTYASDGTFSFNGTSDNINLGNTVNSQFPHNGPWSIQMLVNIKTFTNSFPGLLIKGSSSGSGVILFFSNTGSLLWKHNNAQGVVCNFSFGQAFTLTLTHNGTGIVKAYKNGVYTSNGVSMVSTESTSDLLLGRADQFGNSDIYSFIKYSRELTAAEVQQNFNALRGRYGL